jgi:hypothetical protein
MSIDIFEEDEIFEIQKTHGETGVKLYLAGLKKGAELRPNPRLENEPMYTAKQAAALYLKDSRFKKVSEKWLAQHVANSGSQRAKLYKESDLLEAMSNKGKRINNAA